jgi:hypothetical protein
MTVRQLEALVRISESFARMGLAASADDAHVAAAFDLFTKSTINAMNAGLINSTERLEVCGCSCATLPLTCTCVQTCRAAGAHPKYSLGTGHHDSLAWPL